MTIGSLFMVHRSPFSVSRLADFFSILREVWSFYRPTAKATRIIQKAKGLRRYCKGEKD